MRGRRVRASAVGIAVALGGLAGLAPAANATYHFMKISEVHFDTGPGDGDFVELQMYADGQNSVGGHFVRLYTNAGATQATFTLNSVLNGQNQRTILIGNSDITNADLISGSMEPSAPGGAACFLDNLGVPMDVGFADVGIDCVSWGNFGGTFTDGTPSPVGAPAAPGGMSDEQSLTRLISSGCPTLLEDADDTSSSAADFAITGGTPRPNSVALTEVSCTPATTPTTPTGTTTNKPAAKKKCPKAKKKGKKGAAAAACKKKKKKGKK